MTVATSSSSCGSRSGRRFPCQKHTSTTGGGANPTGVSWIPAPPRLGIFNVAVPCTSAVKRTRHPAPNRTAGCPAERAFKRVNARFWIWLSGKVLETFQIVPCWLQNLAATGAFVPSWLDCGAGSPPPSPGCRQPRTCDWRVCS